MRYLALLALLVLTSCGKDDSKRAPEPAQEPAPIPAPMPEPEPMPDPEPEPMPMPMPMPDPMSEPMPMPEVDGQKLLIILNGTGARCAYYNKVKEAGEKKGYIVKCPESTNTGSGRDGLRSFQKVLSSGTQLRYVLVTGHSQGGVGAVATSYMIQKAHPNLEVDTMAVQPAWFMNQSFRKYARALTGKKLVVCGSRDTVVPCTGVLAGYGSLKEPKKFVVIPATHFNPQKQWAKLLDHFD